MSIDLGFAPCTIADMQVGIVDVPGHENFVKTMVAGASGMDGVILVVAADDGIMPQTREHLDILTLLGIRHGLVALTKIDRVDAEQRELARAELDGLPPRHVPRRGADPAGLQRDGRGLRSVLRGPGRAGRVDPAQARSTASSACRWNARSPSGLRDGCRRDSRVRHRPRRRRSRAPAAGRPGRIRRIEVYGRTSDTVRPASAPR